jgi:hypothetical protein
MIAIAVMTITTMMTPPPHQMRMSHLRRNLPGEPALTMVTPPTRRTMMTMIRVTMTTMIGVMTMTTTVTAATTTMTISSPTTALIS